MTKSFITGKYVTQMKHTGPNPCSIDKKLSSKRTKLVTDMTMVLEHQSFGAG
ncbi:MAG: hypothetical protein MJZ03_02010 [archaeon]|nr:hypothetical protein [archaeon]